eukprot:464026_1
MDPNMKVYHGLNRVLYFERFTAFFNQPISTASTFAAAAGFCQGVGIILTLKSGTEYGTLTSKVPKYLEVAWLSDFPDEDERLFYGGNVHFQIHDIHNINNETNTYQSHKEQLLILNKFQKIIGNRSVQLKETLSDGLAELITNQQIINLKQKKDDVTEYGQSLFSNFCNHINTTSIAINYTSLPPQLHKALFRIEKEDMETTSNFSSKKKDEISLIPVTNLFKHLIEIRITDLFLSRLLYEKDYYLTAVHEYIKNVHSHGAFGDTLMKVTFQSKPQHLRKTNSALQDFVKHYKHMLYKSKWNVEYNFDSNNTLTHILTFTNRNIHENRSNLRNSEEITRCEWKNQFLYFIQVTNIELDHVSVNVSIQDVTGMKLQPRLVLKVSGISNNNISRKKVMMMNGKANVEMPIDAVQERFYHIALFDPINTDDAISNANQIRLHISNNKINNYKPNPVDATTVVCVKDETNDKYAKIYWSIPSESFGKIS